MPAVRPATALLLWLGLLPSIFRLYMLAVFVPAADFSVFAAGLTLLTGLAQDLTAAVVLALPAVLLAAVAELRRWSFAALLLKFYALIVSVWYLAFYCTDAVFFRFSARRLGGEVFAFFGADMIPVLRTGFAAAPVLAVFFGVVVIAGVLLAVRLRQIFGQGRRELSALVIAVAVAFALSPLAYYARMERFSPAVIYQEVEQNLAVNLVVERALLWFLPRYADDTEARERTLAAITLADDAAIAERGLNHGDELQNIVVILLEGVWAGDVSAERAPELLVLREQGVSFSNFYASGLRTRNGLFALLTGWPDLVNYSAVKTYTMYHDFASLPEFLGERGFAPYFIYGGDPSFEGYDRFMRRLGVPAENILGRREMRKRHPRAPATGFGEALHDDVTLAETLRLLSRDDAKKFIVTMLISTHAPFSLPEDANEQSSGVSGNTGADYLRTLRFTGRHVVEMIERARRTEAGRRTLFIVTADHTHQMGLSPVERFHVPFFWIAPGGVNGERSVVAGQPDVLPSIQALFDFQEPPLRTVGADFFRKSPDEGFAFASAGRSISWIDRCGAYHGNVQSASFQPVFHPADAAAAFECRGGVNFDERRRLLYAYFQFTRDTLLKDEFVPARK